MSARTTRQAGVRTALALVVLAALATGCDSDDDGGGEGGDGGATTPGGSTTPGGTAGNGAGAGIGGGDGTFADILGRGPTEEPVDFDASALAADLETVFGTSTNDAVDLVDGDDVDDATGSRRRTASY